MKLKKFFQRIFCKDLLDRIEKLEGTVKHITEERDDYSSKLEAAELAYNLLLSEYNNFKKNPGNARPAKVPHCATCKSCERKEVAVGKVVFTCKKKNRQIFVMEGRTSPQWCPLRILQATEATARNASKAFTSAADALKTFSEEVSKA